MLSHHLKKCINFNDDIVPTSNFITCIIQVRLIVLNVVEVLVSIKKGTVDDGCTVDLEITLVGDEHYLCSH